MGHPSLVLALDYLVLLVSEKPQVPARGASMTAPV